MSKSSYTCYGLEKLLKNNYGQRWWSDTDYDDEEQTYHTHTTLEEVQKRLDYCKRRNPEDLYRVVRRTIITEVI